MNYPTVSAKQGQPICPCGPMNVPVRPQNMGDPRFPKAVPQVLHPYAIQMAQYMPTPPGVMPLPNTACICPKLTVRDPRVRRHSCTSERRRSVRSKSVSSRRKSDRRDSLTSYVEYKDKLYWVFNPEIPGPKANDIICAVPRERNVRERKPTAGDIHKLKKQLLHKLLAEDLEDDTETYSFRLPEFIREPKKGDMIVWQGKSSDGPRKGVRALWTAEKMRDEPDKVCWLGREISDAETDGVFRYETSSPKSGPHVWTSKPGYTLPPIGSNQQRGVDLNRRSKERKSERASLVSTSGQLVNFSTFAQKRCDSTHELPHSNHRPSVNSKISWIEKPTTK